MWVIIGDVAVPNHKTLPLISAPLRFKFCPAGSVDLRYEGRGVGGSSRAVQSELAVTGFKSILLRRLARNSR